MNSFIDRLINYLRIKLLSILKDKTSFVTGASKILELDYGHQKSVKAQQAVDQNDNPIPWFTYPAIDYLDQLDFKNLIMLEWGSGNSSLFFAPRVNKLFSVEHNEEWFKRVKSLNIANHQMSLSNTAEYASTGKRFDTLFDIILIDGIERSACSVVAPSLLKPTGFIILDNSDRHPDVAQRLRGKDFIQVDFHGFGPINEYTWTTSLFLMRGFTCEPLNDQPKIPTGGGY